MTRSTQVIHVELTDVEPSDFVQVLTIVNGLVFQQIDVEAVVTTHPHKCDESPLCAGPESMVAYRYVYPEKFGA